MDSFKSRRDSLQIQRAEHDEVSNARRVKLVNTDFNLKLNYQDDSVTAYNDQLVVSSIDIQSSDKEVIPAIPCFSLKRAQLFVEVVSGLKDCLLTIQVSPIDNGDVWFNIDSLTGDKKCGNIIDICARRIRVIQSQVNGTSTMNVHLVGQG